MSEILFQTILLVLFLGGVVLLISHIEDRRLSTLPAPFTPSQTKQPSESSSQTTVSLLTAGLTFENGLEPEAPCLSSSGPITITKDETFSIAPPMMKFLESVQTDDCLMDTTSLEFSTRQESIVSLLPKEEPSASQTKHQVILETLPGM